MGLSVAPIVEVPNLVAVLALPVIEISQVPELATIVVL